MTSTSKPRRFVPTLTQVVSTAKGSAAPTLALSAEAQQELVMRIMQRLDVTLEQRLPQAVSRLVVEHLQALGPRLWDEVANVVEQSVEQAVASELGDRSKLP